MGSKQWLFFSSNDYSLHSYANTIYPTERYVVLGQLKRKTMPLETLAFNDVLNNDIAHFFKSGTIRRSEKNKQLDKIHHLLPKKGIHGTNLEYDIWYDFEGEEKIRGYVYTDVMTKFVYIKPASSLFSRRLLRKSIKENITEEGERIFQDIANNNTDKYKLRSIEKTYPYIVFLPGTNILNEITDENKIEEAIKKMVLN